MGIIEHLTRAVDFFIDTNRFILEIGGVENVHGGGSACGLSYAVVRGRVWRGCMRAESRERLRGGAGMCVRARAQALLEPISLFDDERAWERGCQAVLVEFRTLTGFVGSLPKLSFVSKQCDCI